MRKIVITGSEGLIGREVSSYFERNGDEVFRLDLKLGHDLTDENFVKEWFMENPVKYVINLFALQHHITDEKTSTSLYSIDLKSFDDYLRVNLTTLFSVCRQFALMNAQGTIVNFSSHYGVVSPDKRLYGGGEEKHIGYGVSKAGVIQLTRHLATHLAPHFRVNCVIPGGVEFNQTKEFKERYSERVPLGRMMKVNELNGLLDYLCSENSTYTTGTTFTVDGGWTAW